MSTTNLFWFWESRIPKNICEDLIKDNFNSENSSDGTYIGPNDTKVIGEKRDTKVCWAPPTSYIGLLLFSHILQANHKAGWLFDVDQIEPPQIGEYSVGGHYDWHKDEPFYTRSSGNLQRKLSISLFLSDPESYEGGDFLFEGNDTPITRKQGSIVVFPSGITHKVAPVTSGVRYSAVAWATGPYFK
jgi:PKHD-type hydroxylase